MSEIPDGVKVSVWHPRPPGGQQVGVDSGIKLEHEGYGLTVIVDNGRSQFKNRQIGLDMMLAGLTNPHLR